MVVVGMEDVGLLLSLELHQGLYLPMHITDQLAFIAVNNIIILFNSNQQSIVLRMAFITLKLRLVRVAGKVCVLIIA